MDDQVSLIVYGKLGYLVVETSNKNLKLPSIALFKNGDFIASAKKLLNENLCLNGNIKGIRKIQRHRDDRVGLVGNLRSRLNIILMVEETPGLPHLGKPTITSHWLTGVEIKQQPKFSLEASTVLMLEGVDEELKSTKTVQTYPCGLLESVSVGRKKMERRRETEKIGDRPQLVRAKSLEDQMLEQAGYGVEELKQIEEAYVDKCGSKSSLMNLEQFSSLMIQLGFKPNLCLQCFNALKVDSESLGIALRELQIGLCCLDPSTIHGGLSAQFRCQFIFYFYNSGREYLHYSEFKQMVSDICTFRMLSLGEEELEKNASDNWRIFCADVVQGISLHVFLNVVGQLKFRGTSVLFRLPRPPVKKLNIESTTMMGPHTPTTDASKKELGGKGSEEDRVEAMDTSTSGVASSTQQGGTKNPDPLYSSYRFTISKEANNGIEEIDTDLLTQQDYTIATHFVKVKRSGTLTDVTTLWDLVGTEAVSGSLEDLDSRPGFDRLPSINAFDKQSKSNEMLSGLRYFEHALKDNGRGQPKIAFSWGAVDMVSVARCFMQLCAKAVDVFSSEPRLLDFTSPCYVLGDLHGNFHDLVCFEKVLWRMGPVLTPATFLFLGDYVDRGPHGFEVVAYLLAQKLLMPSKFLLIRGNHEIRAVQESFSFKDECVDKFGDDLGLELWEAANTAFDAMPIAAVIDKKVFCVHGGIPTPDLEGSGLISAINDIPTILPDPIEQSPLAWDILWNDPIRQDEIDLDVEVQLQENNGFVDNLARGTAHMFSTTALKTFLSRNNLSHVIRAHECKSAGFQIQQHGRLLTVFSSSHYCGATNEAACVLVDSKKIRTIRLDTT